MRIVVSPTGLGRFQSCPEKHRLQQLIDPYFTPRALVRGRAFHGFVERWQQGASQETALAAIDAELASQPLGRMTPSQIEEMELEVGCWTKAMATGYALAYADEQRGAEHLRRVEWKGEAPVGTSPQGHEVVLAGRVDLLSKGVDGCWWVRETKTTSKKPGEDARLAYSFDSQMVAYAVLARELGGEPASGVVRDVVIRSQHRQGAKETLPMLATRLGKAYLEDALQPAGQRSYYWREAIPISEAAIETWRRGTLQLVDTLLTYQQAGGSYPRNTQQCHTYSGPCEFLPVCATGLVDPGLYRNKEVVL